MQQQARLSNGRNNGDRSWSLAMNELGDLEYLLPTDRCEPHSLSVRVISIDQDGMTLAMLEVPISDEPQKPAPQTARDDATPQRQHGDLEELKRSVSERDAQIEALKESLNNALEASSFRWRNTPLPCPGP